MTEVKSVKYLSPIKIKIKLGVGDYITSTYSKEKDGVLFYIEGEEFLLLKKDGKYYIIEKKLYKKED